MSIVQYTQTRYDVVNIREDLSDIIYDISPTDTPFMSSIGKGKASNTYFEWQTDELAAAVTTNAQLEGDNITTTDDLSPTTRVGNYGQISRALVTVSGTMAAMDQAGVKSEVSYQLAKRSAEIKRDMEATLTSDQVAAAGSTSVARKTAALGGWIITNSYGNGTTYAAPIMSSGGGNLSGYPATAAVAGTARAFTSTLLKAAAKDVWAAGGKPRWLMVGPHNKTVFSTFTGVATLYKDVPKGMGTIVGATDVYVTDFGEIYCTPNRFQPESIAYLVDTEYAQVDYIRPFRTEVLAKTADAERRMLIVEYGLRIKQQKAFAAIRDLETS